MHIGWGLSQVMAGAREAPSNGNVKCRTLYPPALQWRVNRTVLFRHQWDWDRGWPQHRAQEEGDEPQTWEWEQRIKIVWWHAQVPERRTRHAMPVQVQQEWMQLLGGEWSERVISLEGASLMGEEQAGRAAGQVRAILVLMMEAAAARRRLQSLLEQE